MQRKTSTTLVCTNSGLKTLNFCNLDRKYKLREQTFQFHERMTYHLVKFCVKKRIKIVKHDSMARYYERAGYQFGQMNNGKRGFERISSPCFKIVRNRKQTEDIC